MRFARRRFRVLAILIAWLVVASFSFLQTLPARASSQFSYDIDLTYRLDNQGVTTVVTNYKVTNNTSDRVLASLVINAPTNDVSNLTATRSDGSLIPTEMTEKTNSAQGYSYQYKEISLRFDRWPGGRGVSQNFIISYQTKDLVDIKGISKTFYVPSLAQIGVDENYTVSVSVPPGYGKLLSTSTLPELNGVDGNLIRYTFPRSSDLKKSVALIFGDSTVYTADFAYPLNNTSRRERQFTVTLPPDTSSQKVFIRKLTPEPVSTSLDADGNILAVYRVPANSKVVVHTTVDAQIKYLEYDLTKSGVKSDIPDDLIKTYTSPTNFWQTTDPELQVKAKQVTAGSTKVIDTVKALQKLTIDTLNYNNEKIKYNIRQGSYKVLRAPDNAVCLEYSDLMVAFLRSQGIPARMPVGYAYGSNLKQSKSVVDSLHSWVEAYVPGIGWMNLDPTWGEKFDNFGKSDLDHFAFAVWGQNDALPSAVMADRQDLNYQYEDTTISYATDFPQTSVVGQINAKKYVIFPGVAVISYNVTAPANVPGDDYSVLIKQGSGVFTQTLGSLAPRQVVSEIMYSIGLIFMKPADLAFIQKSNDGENILAVTSVKPTYWPMYIVLGVITGIFLLYAIQLLIRYRKKSILAKTDDKFMLGDDIEATLAASQKAMISQVESNSPGSHHNTTTEISHHDQSTKK